MRENLRTMLATVSSLLLIGLFVVAVAPVRAANVEDRIKALEQELAQLKGDQKNLRDEALAARKKLPSFRYRPGGGFRVRAADKSWEVRLGSRLMLYMTFWGHAKVKGGSTAQGVLHVRRHRPYFRYLWKHGLYDLSYKIDTGNGGSSGGGDVFAFDAEMYFHLNKLNPWLPTIAAGASPSARLNPQDTNCSSKRCGRSERTFINEGFGVTTGSVDRGIGIIWRKLPLFGPARLSFLNFFYGLDRNKGSGQFNSLSGSKINTDGKSFTVGVGVKPFAKSRNKWIKGIEVSFGGLFEKEPAKGNSANVNVRTNQTRAQRITLIKSASNDRVGLNQYYTPGFGWKIGPYQLRVAGQFANNESNLTGGLVQGRGLRIMHELFLWSARKGLFTGSYKRGGLMIAPMWQFGTVKTPKAGVLKSCGNCKSARATNAGIGLWYYFPGDVHNIGFVWDHYACINCNSDVFKRIKDGTAGDNRSFETFTLVSRFHF